MKKYRRILIGFTANPKIFAFSIVLLLVFMTNGIQAQPGLRIDSASTGVDIRKTSVHGIYIENAGSAGVQVQSAVSDGFRILFGSEDGFDAGIVGNHGLRVGSAGIHGVQILDSGDDAIRVEDAGDDGIDIHGATDDGIYVTGTGGDGIFVNSDVAGYSLHIWGDKNLNETPSGHIAQLYNRNLNSNADVLALRVGRRTQSAWPGTGNNFITFFNGDSVALGRVEGNAAGGVTYNTTGADYGEYLPVMDRNASFKPGDLVGVHEGKISHNTKGATQVMVITDQAAVLGNQPEQADGHKPVSFIGQIPIRVRGPVQAGDWIVPDGNFSGIGIAIPTSELTLSHRIVGRAWESSDKPGVKRVNTAVGLDQSEALMQMIQLQQQQIEQLQHMVMSLKEGS